MRGFPLRAIALLVGSLAACRSAGGSSAAVALRDDGGTYVRLPNPPGRIVSLNPTTTELSFAIGAGSHLIGRSRAREPSAASASELVELAGGRNVFEDIAALSAPVSLQAIFLAGSEMPGLGHRPGWRTLRPRLASLTAGTPSGDSR